jgi:hypothetical protein
MVCADTARRLGTWSGIVGRNRLNKAEEKLYNQKRFAHAETVVGST